MNENYKNPQDGCMDWDDVIENDGQEFIILPEGDYNFTVTGFERGRFPGGSKVPPCNKATITLQVQCDLGIANIRVDLLLYRTLEWKISSFFRCIGQKKHGERLAMNWNNVIGSVGRAHFKARSYTKDGVTRQANDVDKFYDWDAKYFSNEGNNGWNEAIDDDDLPFE